MMYFVYSYNNTVFQDVFQKIAEMHIQFERIHLFEDGNGRTERLLLNSKINLIVSISIDESEHIDIKTEI